MPKTENKSDDVQKIVKMIETYLFEEQVVL